MLRESAVIKAASGDEPTREIAEFIAHLRYEDLPRPVIEAAKDSFLDTLGIALGGAAEEASRIVTRLVLGMRSAPVASLIGQGARTSAEAAALANGTMAHILGFSDFSVRNVLHPSVSVLPAVWALAEELDASGKDVILAHVTGVEVACKLGAVMTPEFSYRGWHPCALLGAFGAAAGAAKLLNLRPEQVACALGLAGIEASGIKVSLGSMTKAFSIGRAAENGVLAARLASAGFTAPSDVLEGRDGFFQTYGAGIANGGLLEALGAPFEFASPGITLKPYPSCTRSHPAIDSALEIRSAHRFDLEDIESVDCSVTPAVLKVVKIKEPRNPLEAKFCMEFCLASALIDGAVDVNTFTDVKLQDRAVRELMGRVSVAVDPRLAALGEMPAKAPFGAFVRIRLKDGRTLDASRDRGPWERAPGAERPARQLLLPKFRRCAAATLGEAAIETVAGIIDALERAPNLRPLMKIVRC